MWPLILLFVVVSRADAALSFIASAKGYSGASSVASIATDSTLNVASGDTLFVAVNTGVTACSGHTVTMSDGSSNTYTAIRSDTGTIHTQCGYSFRAENVAANAALTITATFATGGNLTFAGVSVIQIRGAAASAFDTSAFVVPGTTVTTVTSSAFSTAQADEIIVAAWMRDANSVGGTLSAGSCAGSTCTLAASATYTIGGMEYLIVSSTQTNTTAGFTMSSGGAGVEHVATFKQASAGGATFVPTLTVIAP